MAAKPERDGWAGTLECGHALEGGEAWCPECGAHRKPADAHIIKWVNPTTGSELRGPSEGAVEIRSSGAGWRWHDFDGYEWTTSSGHAGPIWRRR